MRIQSYMQAMNPSRLFPAVPRVTSQGRGKSGIVQAAAVFPRRRLFVAAIALGALALAQISLLPGTPAALAATPGRHLDRPAALAPLLERAARHREPIVLLFSLKGCVWCERLRREQLVSLAKQASSRSIQVIEFDLNDTTPFAQTKRSGTGPALPSDLARIGSPRQLATRLKVSLAPTVVFLGPQGEIAERLEGYNSPDFYSAYLDERIAAARSRLLAAP
ncbi:MAG: thioredoxin fold domain-containing protein [Quisquiliibacterium sp.]